MKIKLLAFLLLLSIGAVAQDTRGNHVFKGHYIFHSTGWWGDFNVTGHFLESGAMDIDGNGVGHLYSTATYGTAVVRNSSTWMVTLNPYFCGPGLSTVGDRADIYCTKDGSRCSFVSTDPNFKWQAEFIRSDVDPIP